VLRIDTIERGKSASRPMKNTWKTTIIIIMMMMTMMTIITITRRIMMAALFATLALATPVEGKRRRDEG